MYGRELEHRYRDDGEYEYWVGARQVGGGTMPKQFDFLILIIIVMWQ